MKKLINKNQKGFTLIEMLIVMIIVGILVVLAFPQASAALTKANETGCEAFQSSVRAKQTSNKLLGLSTNEGINEADGKKVCGNYYTIPDFE